MAKSNKKLWKRARGKLGLFEPLLGSWEANADSPMGPIACRRTFSRIIGGAAVLLEAEWQLPDGKVYQEHAVFAADDSGEIGCWSFTSDGKRSQGTQTDGADVHEEAIAFEAQMPAGLARNIYWPADDGAFHWAVEAKTKKGWNRFTEHRYLAKGGERESR